MKTILSLLILSAGCLPAFAQPVTYTVDATNTSVTIAGALAGLAISEQGPGSLTTSYTGTIDALRGASDITIQNTGLVSAEDSGDWSPNAIGNPGIAPANYGLLATGPVPPGFTVPGLPLGATLSGFTVDAAIRNLQLSQSSALLPVDAAGNFAGDQIEIQTVQMDIAADVVALVTFPFIGVIPVPVTSVVFSVNNQLATNQNPSASVVSSGGIETLTVDLSSILTATAITTNDTMISLTGQLIATRPVMIVTPTNLPPVIDPIADVIIDAGSTAIVTATATDPDAGQTLTFSLDPGAPAGAMITTNGVFSWVTPLLPTMTNALITVRVTDNGMPPLSASTNFTVFLLTNNPPSIAVISDLVVDAGSTAMVTATASDPDAGQTLTFSLDPGAPAGAMITASGAFSWATPLMPATTNVVISVRVTDDGMPPLSASTSFTVFLRTNSAPNLVAIPDVYALAGSTVSVAVVASDPDGGQSLTYSLDPGAPAGASISPSGFFSWVTSTNDAFTTHSISVRVSDDGAPVLDASQGFTVYLAGPPLIEDLRLVSGSWELDVQTMPGFAYNIDQSLEILPASWSLAGSALATSSVHTITVPMPAMDQQMFRAMLP